MVKNLRNPSKQYTEEKLKHHRVHHNRKLFNSNQLNEERKEMFGMLLALAEKCKHVK